MESIRLVGLLIVAPHRHGLSDEDALDARNSGAGSLIRADHIIAAVIELGRARRLVIRNLLAPSAATFLSGSLIELLEDRKRVAAGSVSPKALLN